MQNDVNFNKNQRSVSNKRRTPEMKKSAVLKSEKLKKCLENDISHTSHNKFNNKNQSSSSTATHKNKHSQEKEVNKLLFKIESKQLELRHSSKNKDSQTNVKDIQSENNLNKQICQDNNILPSKKLTNTQKPNSYESAMQENYNPYKQPNFSKNFGQNVCYTSTTYDNKNSPYRDNKKFNYLQNNSNEK